MITIYDIARACNCAPATVCKALNNYYGVSPATKERILAMAESMGYVPDTMARYLITKRSHLVGVLFYVNDYADLNHLLFMSVLSRFKKSLEKKGCDILLLSKDIKSNGGSFLKHCKTRRVDGVLVFGDFTSEPVKELLASDIPTVGYDYMGDDIIGVTSDNSEKMDELTSYLIGLGHKNIVFIKGEDNFVTREREKGFLNAAKKAGLYDNCNIVHGHYYSRASAYEQTCKLLSGAAPPPTAIMYPDDYSAFGGIKAIKEKGLSVPGDISITAYDGIEVFRDIYGLTTVEQNVSEKGRLLAGKLMEAIESPKEYQKKIYKSESKIIFGESCAKVKR